MRKYKNPDGSIVTLTKRKRKCPRCSKLHNWPTEDKLCRECEVEWCKDYKNIFRGVL